MACSRVAQSPECRARNNVAAVLCCWHSSGTCRLHFGQQSSWSPPTCCTHLMSAKTVPSLTRASAKRCWSLHPSSTHLLHALDVGVHHSVNLGKQRPHILSRLPDLREDVSCLQQLLHMHAKACKDPQEQTRTLKCPMQCGSTTNKPDLPKGNGPMKRTSSLASCCSPAAAGASPAGGGGSSTAAPALPPAPDSSPLVHFVRLALRPSPAADTLRRRRAAAAVPLGAAVRAHRAAGCAATVVRGAQALLGAEAAVRPVGTASIAMCVCCF